MNRLKPPLLWPIIDQERRDRDARTLLLMATIFADPSYLLRDL